MLKKTIAIITAAILLMLAMITVGYGFWTEQLDIEGNAMVQIAVPIINDIQETEAPDSEIPDKQAAPESVAENKSEALEESMVEPEESIVEDGQTEPEESIAEDGQTEPEKNTDIDSTAEMQE